MFTVYYRVSIKEDIIWNLQGHSEKGKRNESLNCGTVLPQSYSPKAGIKSKRVQE